MSDKGMFDPPAYDDTDPPEWVHTPRCDVCGREKKVEWYDYKRTVEHVESGEVMQAHTFRPLCESCRSKSRQPTFESRPTLKIVESPQFTTNVLAGKVGQAAVESVLVQFGYSVYAHGYESVFGGAAGAIQSLEPTETAIRVRSMPDILAYRAERDEIVLIEAKGTTSEPEAWKIERHVLRRYLDHWPMALLVVASSVKSEFYCTYVKDLRTHVTPKKALPHPEVRDGAERFDLTRMPWTTLCVKLDLDQSRYDEIRTKIFQALRKWS